MNRQMGIQEKIDLEKRMRLRSWENYQKKYSISQLKTSELNEIFSKHTHRYTPGFKLHYGERGIYRDVARTTAITEDEIGLVVSAIATPSSPYEDSNLGKSDMFNYSFPETKSKTHDEREIEAMNRLIEYKVPLFIIEGASYKTLYYCWVLDVSYTDKQWLCSIGAEPKKLNIFEEDINKQWEVSKNSDDIDVEGTQNVKKRIGQAEFRNNVFKRYASRNLSCAFCFVDNRNIIDAAHIIPYAENKKWGLKQINNPNNGLLLCKNHHKLFDLGDIQINPESLIIFSKNKSKNELKKMGVVHDDLKHLDSIPGRFSLDWVYQKYNT